MWVYESPVEDAAENLALEEYLFERCLSGDVELPGVLIYRDAAAVVCGRSQNIYAEVDLLQAERAGIQVCRRNSGGGAVYHDQGNLNYALFLPAERRDASDFAPELEILIAFLDCHGIRAEIRNTSDVFCEERKISGNARYIRRNLLLHHGTLLFDSDLQSMQGLLSPDTALLNGKGVASRPSPVANLASLLPTMDREGFAEAWLRYLVIVLSEMYPSDLQSTALVSAAYNRGFDAVAAAVRLRASLAEDLPLPYLPRRRIDQTSVHELAACKYRSFAWNFGRSPGFGYDNPDHSIHYAVEKACWIGFRASFLAEGDEAQLIGKPCLPQSLREIGVEEEKLELCFPRHNDVAATG